MKEINLVVNCDETEKNVYDQEYDMLPKYFTCSHNFNTCALWPIILYIWIENIMHATKKTSNYMWLKIHFIQVKLMIKNIIHVSPDKKSELFHYVNIAPQTLVSRLH